jgi:prolyl-tRNA synthetase
MTHADDNGMIMPPRLAPSHVVVLPICRSDADRATVIPYCETLAARLRAQTYDGRPVSVELDTRELNAGEKSWGWTKKGIPITVEVGPRDIASGSVFIARRDRARNERYSATAEEFVSSVPGVLASIQDALLAKARAFRDEHTRTIDSADDFRAFFTPANAEKPEIHGGFAMSHWCDAPACEQKINDDLAVTIRCIPRNRAESGPGACIACGRPSPGRVVFAKAY